VTLREKVTRRRIASETLPTPMARLRPLLVIALAGALALAGCSRKSEDRPNENAKLVLDFQPNAVHAGIYLALERDYDGAEGVNLSVQAPSSSTDSVKLLLSGRAQFAILDIHDLAIAREKGRDIVGVMALVQVPLAAVMAQPQIARPRDLEGKKAGVTGLPSDDAVLSSIVRGDGGDPSKVRKVTIGFQAVAALLAHRVDAATAFWNAEGVALQAQRPGIRQFKVDDYGAPPYPELVLCVSRETLQDHRSLVAATVRALRRGYDETINDPESAVEALVDRAGVKRDVTAQELDAVSPAFTEGADQYGDLDPAKLRRWATWEAQFGITKRPPDVAQAFAPGF
jgi:putative hydroxymethylpyrimidine transport system substrate-binding protein